MYAPMGDGGVYEYVELWYGFAVKKESDAQGYTKHGSCLAWMIWKCLEILSCTPVSFQQMRLNESKV